MIASCTKHPNGRDKDCPLCWVHDSILEAETQVKKTAFGPARKALEHILDAVEKLAIYQELRGER